MNIEDEFNENNSYSSSDSEKLLELDQQKRKEKKALNKGKLIKIQIANLLAMKQEKYLDFDLVEKNKFNYYGQELYNFFSICSKLEDLDESNILLLKSKITYNHLNSLLKETFKHAKRRENLFPIIDRREDYTLKCIYSEELLSDEDGKELQKCDEEHSLPQSYQSGTKKGCGRDLHQMFACSKHANGSRGNKPFGVTNSSIISKETSYGNFYETQIDGEVFKTFVPKYNTSVVSRSTLYILTCYDKAVNKKKFPLTLLNWVIEQSQSEVSIWEKHRNEEIFKLQKNRNPFIDFPFLSKIIDFTEGYQD